MQARSPSVSTKKDGGLQWWQILLGVIALLFIVWLLIKFLPLIVYAIGKVIVVPFKAVGAVNKRRKEKRNGAKADKPVKVKAEKEKYKQKKQASDSSVNDHYEDFSEDIDWDEV